MKVTVLYFAGLRESLGKARDEVVSDHPITAKQAWVMATGRDEMPDNVLIAINQDYVKADAVLADGDELAFFPPVTGG